MGLEVEDREWGTTGRGGDVAAGHFDVISELCAKSKLFDRVRKMWLPHTNTHTFSDRHIISLAGTPTKTNKCS